MSAQPLPVVDMRSDTVTRPTPGMLEAMLRAEVGDDVLGDDPTVQLLQEEVAALLGKEAGLYVPSGTMSNQLALKAQTRPGDQVVLEDGAHIYRYEAGGPALLSGVQLTCVPTPDGLLSWDRVGPALNPDNVHCAPPALVCVENTHNNAGGRIQHQDDVVRLGEEVHARGLRYHLDGARLWHAHVATGTPLARLAAPFDTVSVCFSKGLGAPVGSVLVGDAGTVARAYRFRKVFGGGMRQAGILAEACRYALAHQLDRLVEDHRHARRLVDELDNPHLAVDHEVETNIVIITVAGAGGDASLLAHLEESGVRGIGFGPGRVRLIPNLETGAEAVTRAVAALNSWPGPAQ